MFNSKLLNALFLFHKWNSQLVITDYIKIWMKNAFIRSIRVKRLNCNNK